MCVVDGGKQKIVNISVVIKLKKKIILTYGFEKM